MTASYRKTVFVFIITFSVYFYGIYMFAIGFMPLKTSKLVPSTQKDLPNEPSLDSTPNFSSTHDDLYKSRYKRIVFLLIDALRADFIISSLNQPHLFKQNPFTHINTLLKNGSAIAFPSKAYSPTVTLPRIKTMLTGTLPSFLDLFLNFNAQRINEDNILSQAHSSDKKIVFYGDNTWTKLFPKEFFRKEGTHSFYVSDYQEVDDNVTRHLDNELSHNDWDIMILHYLGVDHIGHVYGPLSHLMPLKLKEMDNIIFKIYSKLKSSKSINSQGDLIVLCGDHGMTPDGNHGGNSQEELLTPLIFISTYDFEYRLSNLSKDILQVDIAATLSVLMGLPIPSNSLGVVITEALQFSGMSNREVLYATHYNMQQLSNIHKNIFTFGSDVLSSSSIQEIFKRHSNWLKYYAYDDSTNTIPDYLYVLNIYLKGMRKLQDTLILHSSGYKKDFMQVGIAVAWTAVSCFVIAHSKFPISMYNLSICFSTLLFIFYVTLHNFLSCICFIIFTLNVCYLLKEIFVFAISQTIRESKYLLFLLLHFVSLASSSFVEEEHQVWYFLCSTMILLHFIAIIFPMFNYIVKITTSYFNNMRMLQKFLPPLSNLKIYTAPVLLLLLHRIFRSWNQTGNKWAHLPDLHDWLSNKQNYVTLQILLIVSFITIYILLKNIISYRGTYVFLSGIIWSFMYKSESGIVKWLWTIFSVKNIRVAGARILFCHSIMLMLIAFSSIVILAISRYPLSCLRQLRHIIGCLAASWTLLVITLSHVENIPLIAGVFLQEFLLNQITWKQCGNTFSNLTNYMVMAMCSFFYVGNSNSVSTIDVFPGYTGLTSYKPLLVGYFILCNTYSCYVLWLLLAFYRLHCRHDCRYDSNTDNNTYDDDMKAEVVAACHGILYYRILILVTYITLIYCQRYHLFILSVFAPKFFYELAHTSVSIGVVLIVFIISQ